MHFKAIHIRSLGSNDCVRISNTFSKELWQYSDRRLTRKTSRRCVYFIVLKFLIYLSPSFVNLNSLSSSSMSQISRLVFLLIRRIPTVYPTNQCFPARSGLWDLRRPKSLPFPIHTLAAAFDAHKRTLWSSDLCRNFFDLMTRFLLVPVDKFITKIFNGTVESLVGSSHGKPENCVKCRSNKEEFQRTVNRKTEAVTFFLLSKESTEWNLPRCICFYRFPTKSVPVGSVHHSF